MSVAMATDSSLLGSELEYEQQEELYQQLLLQVGTLHLVRQYSSASLTCSCELVAVEHHLEMFCARGRDIQKQNKQN